MTSRWGRGRSGLSGTLLLSCLASAAVPLQAQQDTAFVEAIVELRIQRGPTEVLLALARDSLLLLPVHRFAQLAELNITDDLPNERFAGIVEPEGVAFAFDTRQGVAVRGESSVPLGVDGARWLEGTLYVSSALIRRVFLVEVAVDWVNLSVVVRGTGHLPVVRRYQREQRRAVLMRGLSPPEPATDIEVAAAVADGAVLDWSLTSSTRDPFGTVAAELGLGAQLLGGGLVLRHTERNTGVGRYASTEASWSKAWTDRRWLRQLRLGDITSTGRELRGIRGVAVTNEPFFRPSAIGEALLVGSLAPGWDVELYRAEQLLGYTELDRSPRYEFDVPVLYGRNPVDVVAYGPTGEVRRFRRTFFVPLERLPVDRIEYGISAGECRFDRCDAAVNVDGRYGLTDRVTVRAGADLFVRDTLADLWHPYFVVSGAITRALNVTAEAVAYGLVSGRAEYVPTPDLEVTVGHTEFASGIEEPIVGSASIKRATDALLFWRPSKTDRGPFARVLASRVESDVGTRTTGRLSGVARVVGGRFEVAVQHTHEALRTLPSRRRTVLSAVGSRVFLGSLPWLTPLFVRGEFAVDPDTGLTRFSVLASRQINAAWRVELETSWRQGPRGFGVALSLTTALPSLRMFSRNAYTEGSGVEGRQSFEGSVLWNRSQRSVSLGDGRSLGRSGLTGDVYLDDNANGRRDPGELGYPVRRVRVGARAVPTDSLGRFVVWDLVPYEPVRIEIDSTALDNPLWVPLVPAAHLAPRPHTYARVEIPLVRAGELSGRVVFADGGVPVAGIRVLVRHAATGREQRTTSLSDGYFFFLGLAPGRYDVRVESAQLEQLGVVVAPLRLEITIGAVVEDVELRLLRR